jgi:hypothetical protein
MAVTINPSDEDDKGPFAELTIGGGTNQALFVPNDPQSPYLWIDGKWVAAPPGTSVWKDGKWQPSSPSASEEKHGN